MKKIILTIAVASLLSSCTIEDVINYLKGGQGDNLTTEQKNEIEQQSNQLNYNDQSEIDPSKIKPPTNG